MAMSETSDKEGNKAPMPDFEALSQNMARFVEEAGKVTAAYIRPIEEQRAKGGLSDEVGDVVKTLGQVAERWLSDPQRTIEAQGRLSSNFLALWTSTLKRMQILGVYRDVPIGQPTGASEDPNAIDQAKAEVAGVQPTVSDPRDVDHELYECYCELDLDGFAVSLSKR